MNSRVVIDSIDPRPKQYRPFIEDYSHITAGSFAIGYYLGVHNKIIIEINRLESKSLIKPLQVIIEPDADGFIARNPDIPLYGFGDDSMEAVEALKYEIESLYENLMEDDEFTDEWLTIKKFLQSIIVE